MDRIRIDHTFGEGLDLGHPSLPLIRAIPAPVRTWPLAATAEGVEAGAPLEILRAEG